MVSRGGRHGELGGRSKIDPASDFCANCASSLLLDVSVILRGIASDGLRGVGILSKEGQGLGFWASVLSGVLALVVGSIVLAFVQAARQLAVRVLSAIWSALIFPVPIPAALLALLVCIAVFAWWRWYSLQRDTEGLPPALSENEVLVIRALARADGTGRRARELADVAHLSVLLTQQALHMLRGRDFVGFNKTQQGRVYYHFTSAGRNYAIDRGYVKQQRAKKAS